MINRAPFGTWGAALNDDDFARAVAAMGVIGGVFDRGLQPAGMGNDSPPSILLHSLFNTAVYGARPLQISSPFHFWLAERRVTLPVSLLRDWWNSVPEESRRLEVIGALSSDVMVLIDLLSSGAVGAASVYLRHDQPEVEVVWNWPLRIGVLPVLREEEAHRIATIPWPELTEIIVLNETVSDCDLLPGSLPAALASVLQLPWRPRADCVLVLGNPKGSSDRTLPLLSSLRSWCETAGIAVGSVPRDRRERWFRDFMQELSHNHPLDVALHRASVRSVVAPPILVASRRLIEAAQISAHVARVIEHLETAAAVPRMGAELSTMDLDAVAAAGQQPLPTAADFRSAMETRVFDSELFVITHIDADHIGGAVQFLKQADRNGITFGDIWFNGWDQIIEKSGVLGARDAELVSETLRTKQLPWNNAFDGKAVVIDTKLPQKLIAGGVQITLLSPFRAQLHDLIPAWQKELRKAGLLDADSNRLRPSDVLGGAQPADLGSKTIDFDELLAEPSESDEAEANGSSIGFLLEYEKIRAIFTGDAHVPVIQKSLKQLRRTGPVVADVIKVAHRGSKANISTALLEKLDCPRYLISTSGAIFHHPDRAGIARIIRHGGERPALYFNYDTGFNRCWNEPATLRKAKYETHYPQKGQGYVLEF